MKKNTLSLLSTLFCSLLLFTSCKDDDPSGPTPEEVQTQKLIATWIVGEEGSVTRDDISSEEWDNFTLTFTESNFSTTNTYETVWPAEGSWQFVEGNLNKIERNDGLDIDIVVEETTLDMTFTLSQSNDNGRFKGVPGEYTFHLVKQ